MKRSLINRAFGLDLESPSGFQRIGWILFCVGFELAGILLFVVVLGWLR